MTMMKQPFYKKFALLALCGIFLSACSSKYPSKAELKKQNCNAFNLISVFASNPNVKEVIDLRSHDQKTYENTLFNVKEYCHFSNKKVSDMINEYELRTEYSNQIVYKNGIVTINPSGKNYYFLDDTFNFVALSRDKKSLKYFKNKQTIKFGDERLNIEVLKDFKNEKNPYVLRLIITDKLVNKTTKILKTTKNYFTFGEFLILF